MKTARRFKQPKPIAMVRWLSHDNLESPQPTCPPAKPNAETADPFPLIFPLAANSWKSLRRPEYSALQDVAAAAVLGSTRASFSSKQPVQRIRSLVDERFGIMRIGMEVLES